MLALIYHLLATVTMKEPGSLSDLFLPSLHSQSPLKTEIRAFLIIELVTVPLKSRLTK